MRCAIPLILLTLSAPAVLAEPGETLFNQVYLEAQAEREVENDEVAFVFVALAQGNSPRELARRVNADMDWGVQQAKRVTGLKVSTGAYSTRPVYDKGSISAWEVRQELHVVGTDMTAASDLAGSLQDRLQLQGVDFRPGSASRQQTEDDLIEEAMKAFHHRAELVGRQMDGKEYRIVEIHVSTQGPVRPMAFAERGVAMAKSAPVMEAGSSTVQVTISGNVQFY